MKQEHNSHELYDFYHENKDNIEDNVNNEISNNMEIPPFIMTIDIDQGKSEKLKIYFDSNPEELAFDFCKRNNLDYNAMLYLKDEIKTVISNNDESGLKKNQIQEMIKEENEEDEQHTDKNIEEEEQQQEAIKSESNMKEILNLNIENKLNEEKKNLFEIEVNPQSKFQEENKQEKQPFSDYNNVLNTNPELNLGALTSSDNFNDKEIINTEVNKIKISSNNYSGNQFKNLRTFDSKRDLMEIENKKNANIFDKLYRDAEIRRKFVRRNSDKNYRIKSEESTFNNNDLSKKKSCKNLLSPQSRERLYNKSFNAISKNHDNLSSENNIFTNDKCSIKPFTNINHYYSDKLLKKTSYLKNYNEYINNTNYNKEEKLKVLRDKYVTDEIYSFSPSINKKSYEIVNAKYSRLQSENNQSPSNESFNKHNELYKNYKQRQMKIQQLTEQVYSEYNFIPETNNNYKIDQDFITRQETHKRKLQEKLKEKEAYDANPIDKLNGQKLFQPNILMSNLTSPRSSKNLVNYMYNFTNLYSYNKNIKNLQIQDDFRKNSNTVHTRQKSKDLFKKMKLKSFKKIFSLLDSDEDKMISNFCISYQKIPNKIKEIIKPIISKIKEENCVISEKEFIEYCELIYETLTKDKRHIVLNFEKKSSESNSIEKLKLNKEDKINKFQTKSSGFDLKQTKLKTNSKSITFDSINRFFVMHSTK